MPDLTCMYRVIALALALLAFSAVADDSAAVSPKPGWGDFEVFEEREPPPSTLRTVLLWIPNRFLDFIDLFRFDVGVGPSYGAAIRVSKYIQTGYREMNPMSLRIGNFGRKAPYLLERSNEFGAPFFYLPSKDRKVCPGEIGAGADLFIAGAYAGICVEEVVDFIGGLFFVDLKGDDIR